MNASSLDPSELHHALARVDTVAACMKVFKDTIGPVGFDTYACGEVDLHNRERVVFFAVDWPADWLAFYQSSRLSERDPVLDALAYRHEAFTWTELRKDRKLAKIGSQVLESAAQRGWTEGLVVPLARSAGRYGLVSLVGKRNDLSEPEKKALSLAATSFHARVRYLAPRNGFPTPPFGLTPRELDCLNFVTDGLSDREVGEKLAISTSTAHEYIEGSKRKLKARTRTQAVATAMCFGLLRV